MEFIEQFKAALRVSTPLICIRTFDAKSTISAVIDALNGSKDTTPLLLWDAIHGLVPIGDSEINQEGLNAILGGSPQLTTVPLPDMLRMAESPELSDAIVFLANAHLQWQVNGQPDPVVIQGIWNLRDVYKANGNALVLLATPGSRLPAELVNDVLVLDEPLPTVEALQETVRNTFKFAKVENKPDEKLITKATDALIGLPSFSAEQAAAMCLNIDRTDPKKLTGKLGLSDLWERKRQIINQTPGLSVYSGKETLDDIGGVSAVKEFLRAFMEGNNPPKAILFIDEIEKAMAGSGTDMSGVKSELNGSLLSWTQDKEIEGMLFLGIPGVSKSAVSKGLGGTYGVPVVNFDIAGMQSGIIGSSGENLRGAQKTVDAISGWAAGQGGKVLAIATCNGIASLSPELRRRFSLAQFFFDAPTREEKDVIWAIHRKKQHIPESDVNPNDEGWTGAEIESCCKKAYRLNWSLEKASKYIVPVTVSASDAIAKTRAEASGKYLSASEPGIYYADRATATPKISGPVYAEGNAGRKIRA